MKHIATVLLVLMTVALITSGIALWKRRKETKDHSRTIQAVFSWVSAFFAMAFIIRTWEGNTAIDGGFFEPEHTFMPILFQMAFFLYPLEVIQPTISRTRLYAYIFSPLVLLVFIGLNTGIEYTPIYSFADLWNHIGEPNVIFRIFTLLVLLSYGFALFLVPYDWRRSSADKKFILNYALGVCMISLLHFAIQISHSYLLVILHQIVWILFFIAVAHYDLKERLLVPQSIDGAEEEEDSEESSDRLWEQITILMEVHEKWRSPYLSLVLLSEQLESNRTYVGEAFKRNTGMTFVEYITKRRIDYVVEALKKNPEANIQELFNYVGYRQRSTALRNFHKITNMSPTGFIESLK